MESETVRLKKSPSRLAYTTAMREINRELKIAGKGTNLFRRPEAEQIYKKYGGRCAFCGVNLVIASSSMSGIAFMFYTPLNVGGSPTISNVILVCKAHKARYRPIREAREDILDINTIADYIEHLIRAIKNDGDREKILRIKRILNGKFTDLAVNMRYVTFSGNMPEDIEIVEEGVNTVPDLIQDLADKSLDSPPGDVLSSKQKVTESLKQIDSTKQYKIIKKKPEPKVSLFTRPNAPRKYKPRKQK